MLGLTILQTYMYLGSTQAEPKDTRSGSKPDPCYPGLTIDQTWIYGVITLSLMFLNINLD